MMMFIDAFLDSLAIVGNFPGLRVIGEWMVNNLSSYCYRVGWLHFFMALALSGMAIAQSVGAWEVDRLVMPVTAMLGTWRRKNSTDVDASAEITGMLDIDLSDKCTLHKPYEARDSKFSVVHLMIDRGEIDTRVLIVLFHALSWIFQISNSSDRETYDTVLNLGNIHVTHFFEYSLSATLMVVAICGQLGVTDLYLILNVALNCWSCMILGAIAEVCFVHRETVYITYYSKSDDTKKNESFVSADKGESGSSVKKELRIPIYRIAHFSGWITLMAGSTVGAMSNITMYNECLSGTGNRIPEAVLALVYTEIALFLMFGLVQFLWFYAVCRYPDTTSDNKQNQIRFAKNTEAAYITLSATAKIVLGVGIYLSNSRYS